jgi:hypothetical protein
VYDGGKIAGYKVKFKGIINEAGASNGSWLGQFGDSTITGVSTAPTVSAVNPANAATGVTQNNVTATISQALYAPDVTADSVLLIEDPTGTPTVYACNAPVLVNNGSSTTITLTAANGSNFTASKSYTFVINGTVRNQNLVPFAASFLSHFAT